MATAISVIANLLREELPSVIDESLPDIAPVYKYIDRSSLKVTRKMIGRGWQVIHLFSTGLAGLIQHANAAGATMTTNTNYPQSTILSSGMSIFPTATDAPHTGSIKRLLTLHMSTGNFSVPITWLSADALDASQIEQVGRDIKEVGNLRALTEAQSFFMASNNTLAQIDNYDATNEASGYVTFTVKVGSGRTSYFRVGMMVDFLETSAGVPQFGTAVDGTNVMNYETGSAGYIPLIVSDVDYFTGTIKVAAVAGTSLAGANLMGDAPADDDWVILRGCNVASRQMRSWGLNDWIASSGRIMDTGGLSTDGVDLDTYAQFKSKIKAVNGPLTDTVMNGYIGGFLDAFPGASIDTLITTMGTTLKYIEQPQLYNNRMFYDRQGKALDVKGGWDDVTYVFNGRKFRWMISPFCATGTLYGVKLNNGNIKRYIPPRVGGSDSRVGSEIEFLATLAGHSSVFKVAHASTGASQAVLEAPFWQYQLVCPIDVKSVKLTGLTEATMS